MAVVQDPSQRPGMHEVLAELQKIEADDFCMADLVPPPPPPELIKKQEEEVWADMGVASIKSRGFDLGCARQCLLRSIPAALQQPGTRAAAMQRHDQQAVRSFKVNGCCGCGCTACCLLC